jgi:phage terminase large subunit GpA-like protein
MPESVETRPGGSWSDYRASAASADALARAFDLWRPPPHIDLVRFIESSLILPPSASASPGPVQLWPHQRGIADAIADPNIEKIVVQKAARTGYTLLLGGVIGSYVANAPAPILCIVPAEADAKNFVTDQLESVFDASPALRGKLSAGKRNRLLYRQFAGGWIRVVAAKAPRNLRAHTAKVVIFDEIDAFDISAGGAGGGEGDPIALGIKRADTFAGRGRKIILGGTPLDSETSHVIREYNNSNAAVFEIPCPHCGAFFELLWEHIRWDEGRPETARAECPHCGGRILESEKSIVVSKGQWRITRPEITNVAGFRLSALIAAGNPAAAWPTLAAEWLKAKRSPDTLKPFINTVLGAGWEYRDGDGMDEHVLAKRAEPWGLDNMPADVRILVAGIDVQAWGLCVLTVGFSTDQTFILDYRDLHGDPLGDEVWKDADSYILRQRFNHPMGGTLGFDAVAIDAGNGNHTQKIYGYTKPRFGRRVISTIGRDGNRPLIEKSSKPGMYVLGVDTLKNRIWDLLAEEGHIRFSADLPARLYEEICAERVVTKYRDGRPKRTWVKTVGARNEGLDCLAMALGVRQLVGVDLLARQNELMNIASAPKLATVHRSKWMQGIRE